MNVKMDTDLDDITIFISAHSHTQGDVGLNYNNKIKMVSAAACGFSNAMGYNEGFGSMDKNLMNRMIEFYNMIDESKGKSIYESFYQHDSKEKARILNTIKEIMYETHKDSSVDLQEYNNTNEQNFYEVYTPRHERFFSLKPNKHENCAHNEQCSKGERRCIPLKRDKQYVPDYGVFIVSSSKEEDNKFSLMRKPQSTDTKNPIELANINEHLSTREYWRNRLVDGINKFKDHFKDDFETEFENHMLYLYDRLLVEEREITLYDIIIIFTVMGFDEIHIIDPSCRTIVEGYNPDSLKIVEYSEDVYNYLKEQMKKIYTDKDTKQFVKNYLERMEAKGNRKSLLRIIGNTPCTIAGKKKKKRTKKMKNKEKSKKNRTKTNKRTILKIKKKGGSELRENMKRQLSNNLVISFTLAGDSELSENDARSRAANLNNSQYGNIVLVMQMELEEIAYKIYRKPLNQVTLEEYLRLSEDMINYRGNPESVINKYENVTISDLGGKKEKE